MPRDAPPPAGRDGGPGAVSEGQQDSWPPCHGDCVPPVYAAGKAATSGVPSIYAPSTYAYLSPAKTPPPPPAMIPMGPVYNGYPADFDRNSSGEARVKQALPGWGLGEGRSREGRWTATDGQSPAVGGHSSQVPLLRDTDSSVTSGKQWFRGGHACRGAGWAGPRPTLPGWPLCSVPRSPQWLQDSGQPAG